VSNLDLTAELVQPYVFSNRIKGSWSFPISLTKRFPTCRNLPEQIRVYEQVHGVHEAGSSTGRWKPSPREKRQLLCGLEQSARAAADPLLQLAAIQLYTRSRYSGRDERSFPRRGTITRPSWTRRDSSRFSSRGCSRNLPISQFYRVILTGRWYTEAAAHRYSILAFKLKGGFEDKYAGPVRTPVSSFRRPPVLRGRGEQHSGWNSRDLIAAGHRRTPGSLAEISTWRGAWS